MSVQPGHYETMPAGASHFIHPFSSRADVISALLRLGFARHSLMPCPRAARADCGWLDGPIPLATGRLARRAQQDPAASRPVEQRVDHRGAQRRPRAAPDHVREPRGPSHTEPPFPEPSNHQHNSTAPAGPAWRGPWPPPRESAAGTLARKPEERPPAAGRQEAT